MSKEFNDYRDQVNNELPELSRKIFDFRHVTYLGCGFHWALEKRLGTLISMINDYDRHYSETEEIMIE